MKKTKHEKILENKEKEKSKHLERIATQMLKQDEQKDKLKVIFNRFMNVAIVTATLIGGFGLGYYFNELKMKPKAVNETILNKEVRIAIDSEDKLIMMDRKTGSYTIYSDSVGRIIFKMYASKIASPVVTK